MKNFAAFSARDVKRAAAADEREKVFLCRRTVKVEVTSKIIPTSFLKIEKRGTFVGAKVGFLDTDKIHRMRRDKVWY